MPGYFTCKALRSSYLVPSTLPVRPVERTTQTAIVTPDCRNAPVTVQGSARYITMCSSPGSAGLPAGCGPGSLSARQTTATVSPFRPHGRYRRSRLNAPGDTSPRSSSSWHTTQTGKPLHHGNLYCHTPKWNRRNNCPWPLPPPTNWTSVAEKYGCHSRSSLSAGPPLRTYLRKLLTDIIDAPIYADPTSSSRKLRLQEHVNPPYFSGVYP
jgi:hypothetical protein